MGERTGIGWTGSTWNPLRARHLVTGRIGWACVRVSPGCLHCYAATQNEAAHRYGTGEDYTAPALDRVVPYLDLKAVALPLSWRAPRRIFVCSMTDLFAEWVPDEWIDRVFAVMALAPQHTFQVLTKRPERMRAYLEQVSDERDMQRWARWADIAKSPCAAGIFDELDWPIANAHLGVSVEDQPTADARIPLLLQTPAVVRFVSYEPMLAAVDFSRWLSPCSYYCDHEQQYPAGHHPERGLDGLICGGESGPHARPCDLAWIRSVVAQCRAAGVRAFVKQLGARPFFANLSEEMRACVRRIDFRSVPPSGGYLILRDRAGADPSEWPGDLRVREWPR